MIKDKAVKLLRFILKELSRLVVWKYSPEIVGVTGSVGKTSAKLATAAVLAGSRRVRYLRGNLNNELGVPLAILGNWSAEELRLISREYPAGRDRFKKAKFWLKVIFRSAAILARGNKSDYPEVIILEYGADRPGDIKYLLSLARPATAIVTAIGESPVHLEFYKSADELAREKMRLIEALPSSGYAILNADDETVMKFKERTRAHIVTYGFSEKAHVRILNFENKSAGGEIDGISCKFEYGGSSVPVRIEGVVGRAAALSAAAAASVGVVYGLNLVKISQNLSFYRAPDGRLKVLSGLNGSTILDDSYNASPLSMTAALETLSSFSSKRKIAVLGDMLELGGQTEEEHRKIGKKAAKTADVLLTIGSKSKFMAESALEAGFQKKNLQSFEEVSAAEAPLRQILRAGDVVLLKASHAMRFEELVKILSAPAHAGNPAVQKESVE